MSGAGREQTPCQWEPSGRMHPGEQWCDVHQHLSTDPGRKHGPGATVLTCTACGISQDCAVEECRTLWLAKHVGHPISGSATAREKVEPSCSRCWRPVGGPGAQTCDRPHGQTP